MNTWTILSCLFILATGLNAFAGEPYALPLIAALVFSIVGFCRAYDRAVGND